MKNVNDVRKLPTSIGYTKHENRFREKTFCSAEEINLFRLDCYVDGTKPFRLPKI